MGPNDMIKEYNPTENPKPISRKAKRAGKRIKEELNSYIVSFFLFRDKQKDKENKDVIQHLNYLDFKWRNFANNWKNSKIRMKKSDNISPNLEAFISKVKELIKLIEKEQNK